MTAPAGIPPRDRAVLWLAQGFGSGRLRPAPGTWGSLVGVAWTLLLLAVPSPWFYLAAVAVSLPVAVAACSAAERILGRHDPGSVVLDEIVALPIAFGGYAVHWAIGTGQMPAWDDARLWWPFMAGAFVLFRLFDIWKPWPIRLADRRVHGGIGIMLDDVLAGILAVAVLLFVQVFR